MDSRTKGPRAVGSATGGAQAPGLVIILPPSSCRAGSNQSKIFPAVSGRTLLVRRAVSTSCFNELKAPSLSQGLSGECVPRRGIRFLAEARRIGDGEPRRKPAGPGARRPRNPRRQDDSVPMILLPPWPWQSAAGVESHRSDNRDRHVTSPVHGGFYRIMGTKSWESRVFGRQESVRRGRRTVGGVLSLRLRSGP